MRREPFYLVKEHGGLMLRVLFYWQASGPRTFQPQVNVTIERSSSRGEVAATSTVQILRELLRVAVIERRAWLERGLIDEDQAALYKSAVFELAAALQLEKEAQE